MTRIETEPVARNHDAHPTSDIANRGAELEEFHGAVAGALQPRRSRPRGEPRRAVERKRHWTAEGCGPTMTYRMTYPTTRHPAGPPVSKMATIVTCCLRHRRLVVLIWAVGIGLSLLYLTMIDNRYSDEFSAPASESTSALATLHAQLSGPPGDSVTVVAHSRSGRRVDDPAERATLDDLFGSIRKCEHVRALSTPFTPEGRGQVSPDGTVAYATVYFDQSGPDLSPAVRQVVDSAAKAARTSGLEVDVGGEAVSRATRGGGIFLTLGWPEILGLGGAAIILLLTLRSPVAMLLPLVSAGAAVFTGLAVVGLGSYVWPAASFSPELVKLVGFGVGIDYALFVVSRFRQAVRHQEDVSAAVVAAMSTAGRVVIFAGMTVCVAMLSLFTLDLDLLYSVATAASITVALSMICAITLLPALLGLCGRRIPAPRVRAPGSSPAADGHAHRLSKCVERHPWRALILGVGVLGVLWLPGFGLPIGSADASVDPTSSTTRHAYDLLARGFGPGFNGPLLLVATARGPMDAESLTRLGTDVARDGEVAAVAPLQWNADRTTAVLTVFPRSAPNTEPTESLLGRVREKIVPVATANTGLHVDVGGVTATSVDIAGVLDRAQWWFKGLVMMVSALLLLWVFRSLGIPVKAAALNWASVQAALGVVGLVFSRGWFAGLLHVETGPIAPFLPIMIFAMTFGVSMDYEMFIISRIREEWLRSGRNEEAVTKGLSHTVGVVSAAASIMAVVFGAFAVFGDDRMIQMFGLGLFAAIVLDVTIIRCLVLPATLHLCGDRVNWGLPAWMSRLLPELTLEGEKHAAERADETRQRPVIDKRAAKNSSEGVVEVRATSGDNHLGGDDLDERIVKWLVDKFKSSNGIDLTNDDIALQRIREAAKKAKIALASSNSASINLPYITVDADKNPMFLDEALSRAEFQKITSDLARAALNYVSVHKGPRPTVDPLSAKSNIIYPPPVGRQILPPE
jgi:RND superfamily putative drug exporter